jgi:hypothetical protein
VLRAFTPAQPTLRLCDFEAAAASMVPASLVTLTLRGLDPPELLLVLIVARLEKRGIVEYSFDSLLIE